MRVQIELTLPREAESAPLARRTIDASLRGLGVDSDVRAEIALALGEACANVIQHADASEEYEVRARVDDLRCAVDVIDDGAGVDGGALGAVPPSAPPDDPPDDAEHGRGLRIIQALTENLRIYRRPHGMGAVVHFEKLLAPRRKPRPTLSLTV